MLCPCSIRALSGSIRWTRLLRLRLLRQAHKPPGLDCRPRLRRASTPRPRLHRALTPQTSTPPGLDCRPRLGGQNCPASVDLDSAGPRFVLNLNYSGVRPAEGRCSKTCRSFLQWRRGIERQKRSARSIFASWCLTTPFPQQNLEVANACFGVGSLKILPGGGGFPKSQYYAGVDVGFGLCQKNEIRNFF